jgi:nucleoid DNA-binding protein
MFKADLVNSIVEQLKAEEIVVSKTVVRKVIDVFVSTVVSNLSSGAKITLKGFGTFLPSFRKARSYRNPATGEIINADSTYRPKFKPSSSFVNLLRAK